MREESRNSQGLEEETVLSERCAAVFVTYMPSADIAGHVNRVIAQGVGAVIVVDNTPNDSFFSAFSPGLFSKEPQLVRNKKNLGVARALNQGVELAREQGFEWVLTFDQDTVVKENFLSQMIQTLERISAGSVRPVAVLGANYIDTVLDRPAHDAGAAAGAVEVREVITSGSMVSIAAFSAVGGFAEKLFIDMVDTEFCFRARQAGYSVWRTSLPLMEHSLGKLSPCKFLGMRFNVTNHLPERRYYIFRNTLYMVWQFKMFDPLWALRMLCDYLPKTLIKACLFESQPGRNFLYILRGVRDSVFARYDRNVL